MGAARGGEHPRLGRGAGRGRAARRTPRRGPRILALADRGDLLQPAGGRQPGDRLCGRRPDAGGPSAGPGGAVRPRAGTAAVHRRDPRPPGRRPGCPAAPRARRRLRQQLRPDLPVLPRPGPPRQRRGGLRRGRRQPGPLHRRPPDQWRLRQRRRALQRAALRLRVGPRPALLRRPCWRRPGPLPGRHPLGPACGQGRRGVDGHFAWMLVWQIQDTTHWHREPPPRPHGTNCARARCRWPSTPG